MNGTTSRSRGDWTNMTISDWLESTPADWMAQAIPGWQDWSYGDLLATSPRDVLMRMYEPWSTQTAGPAVRPQRPHGRRHHHDRHDCGCHDAEHHDHHRHHEPCRHCGPEPCECYCCLGDVDLAVYARFGDRRVVPISIENERRREKEITLELSDWTTRGGNPGPVRTDFLAPVKFTLAPCGEQDVVLVVDVQPTGQGKGDILQRDAAAEKGQEGRTKIPDVDTCEVVTADLRVVGCDHRPIRIAVAILPRDCDPYRVPCGCTCC